MAMRAILHKPFREHSTPLFKALQILPINDLIFYEVVCILFKINPIFSLKIRFSMAILLEIVLNATYLIIVQKLAKPPSTDKQLTYGTPFHRNSKKLPQYRYSKEHSSVMQSKMSLSSYLFFQFLSSLRSFQCTQCSILNLFFRLLMQLLVFLCCFIPCMIFLNKTILSQGFWKTQFLTLGFVL